VNIAVRQAHGHEQSRMEDCLLKDTKHQTTNIELQIQGFGKMILIWPQKGAKIRNNKK